jgi:cell division protein FtsL
MAIADVVKQPHYQGEEKSSYGVHYTSLLVIAFVLTAVALLYVWSHVNMTKLEYQVAEALSTKQRLLEEQKKLRVAVATLKAPQRIEVIARDRLHMVYPERGQVVVIK